MTFLKGFLVAVVLALAGPAGAADLVASYTARIGNADLYNSNGARLTEAWQVLRQDRANYHRFGISQPGDEWDPVFGNIDNRAALERMIMRGGMAPEVRRRVMQGGTLVDVRIYGSGGQGRWAEVTLAGPAGSAGAANLVASYAAYIGNADLYNSKGMRLSEPWQVLRQDRANFHRFGISQPGDEWDPLFGSIDNRAALEQLVMRGSIDPAARRNLMQGGATVFVRVYGSGGQAQRVDVTVVR
ncbi:hypothetical protein [Roseovarius salinarum]|uniref:hypothetical protein n=1 Tax=Roseovarius salinarum TaxID=1981892 RepID=UPI001E4CDA1B|nr:hypothetical protein [Roseovarius salinarum]